jgi:hypothetical protein
MACTKPQCTPLSFGRSMPPLHEAQSAFSSWPASHIFTSVGWRISGLATESRSASPFPIAALVSVGDTASCPPTRCTSSGPSA